MANEDSSVSEVANIMRMVCNEKNLVTRNNIHPLPKSSVGILHFIIIYLSYEAFSYVIKDVKTLYFNT